MTKSRVRKFTARQLAVEAARIAQSRHAEDIVVLDLRGVSPVTDYFVIFTGTSERQMVSVAEEIADAAAAAGHKALHAAGLQAGQPARRSPKGGGGWVLLDFIDVVVHIFDETHRRYYDLELIWGDAPRVRWKRRSRTRQK